MQSQRHPGHRRRVADGTDHQRQEVIEAKRAGHAFIEKAQKADEQRFHHGNDRAKLSEKDFPSEAPPGIHERIHDAQGEDGIERQLAARFRTGQTAADVDNEKTHGQSQPANAQRDEFRFQIFAQRIEDFAVGRPCVPWSFCVRTGHPGSLITDYRLTSLTEHV